MKLSTGQLIFAALFIVAFLIGMIWAYRSDRAMNKTYYKGSVWVLAGVLLFIAMYKLAIKLFH